MRRAGLALLCMLLLRSVAALQFEIIPMEGVTVAEPLIVVEPSYPAEQLAAGIGAAFDVLLTVDRQMRVTNVEVVGDSPNAAFLEAFKRATPLWLVPPGMTKCTEAVPKVMMRIWFEVDGGKPKFSFGIPSKSTHRLPADPLYKPVEKDFPIDYPREAVKAKITRGFVLATMQIRKDGTVERVSAIGATHDSFAVETKSALQHWRFPPDVRENAELRCGSVRVEFMTH